MLSGIDLYPSRTGGKEHIIPRQDPVVYEGDTQQIGQPLTQAQLGAYEKDGFLILPDYLPEMVEPLIKESHKLRTEMEGMDELVTEPDSNELRTLFKPFAYSSYINDFFRHPKIVNIAKQLLGSDVYMMQSRLNVKPAYRGKSFAWHSDFETWHVEDGMPRMRAVTAWIMLTENSEHNGPLYVIPGSHRYYISCEGKTGRDNHKQSLKKQKLGVPKPETMSQILKDSEIKSITGKPGTVVFHECNLLHGSPDNISGNARSILMCVYNSTENVPVAPFGGLNPRPHYLSNPDHSPVMPLIRQSKAD